MTHPPISIDMITHATRALLAALGEDTAREGLKNTPARVAKFYEEWLSMPEPVLTSFDAEGMITTPIVQGGIPVYSLCEHHLLPFFGTAVVAYLPDARIVGLSKLARVVRYHASRPQNQERITRLAAEHLFNAPGLRPIAVGVSVEARHLCMEMRGVKATGSTTSTMHVLARDSSDHTPADFHEATIKRALEAYQRGA